MNQTSTVLTPDAFRIFAPVNELGEEQLKTLVDCSTVEQIRPGTQIIQRGTTDHWTFYLLEGQLELEALDGDKVVIKAGTASAMNPIAQLKPRQYSVTALSPVRLLKVETSQLERLLDPQGNGGIDVAESLQNSHNDDAGGIEAQLYCDIYRAVIRDALVLPSLPEVAIKIRKLLENEDVSTKQLARVVQTDSSIAAKLVKAANSALYAGATTVDSVSQALVRLGMKTTSELVLCYAISELFQAQSRLLQSRMQSLWRHSAHVAAISFVLAQKTGRFDPERALLMGLLHDVGVLPILSYLDRYPEAANAPQQVEQAIRALRGEIGNLILSKWNFPEDFGTTALEVEDWGRDPRPEPDYCDLVMIAQLHSFIDTGDVLMAPPMNQVPAFRKLELGQLTPQMGLALLDEATEQIDEVMRMLSL